MLHFYKSLHVWLNRMKVSVSHTHPWFALLLHVVWVGSLWREAESLFHVVKSLWKWRLVVQTFLCNCGCPLILYHSLTSDSFVKVTYCVEFEKIVILSCVKIHWPGIHFDGLYPCMLPLCKFAACALVIWKVLLSELSDLPNVGTFHFPIWIKSYSWKITTDAHQKIFKYWEFVKLLVFQSSELWLKV